MGNIIGIVNYGIAGNIHSIKKAIEKAGGETLIINSAEDLLQAHKIVIPGVGSFKEAMYELEKDNLLEPLKDAISEKPTLGICLGMQILSTVGFEYGETKGLNKIQAEVKRIEVNARIPHMGFNTIKVTKPCEILKGIENEKFYFMHSYEFVNYTDIVSLSTYEGHEFVSAVQKGNIFGVQFHPEKSREQGIKLFHNFINF